MLLVAALVLLYRRHSRGSRNEANLRISRDRANLDLQMISHQVHKAQTQVESSGSLRRPASLAGAPAASLPPGPPSSSAWDPSELLGGFEVTQLPAERKWIFDLTEVDRKQISLDDGRSDLVLASPTPTIVPELQLGELDDLSGLPLEFDDPPLDLNWVLEAGLSDEIVGVERSGVATAMAPTLSALDVRSELDRAELVDLAELAKLAGLASGLEDLGNGEAVEQEMAQVMMDMEMQMQYLPNQEMASTLNLQEKFETLVMVNYTPRSPTELPKAQWASCDLIAIRT